MEDRKVPVKQAGGWREGFRPVQVLRTAGPLARQRQRTKKSRREGGYDITRIRSVHALRAQHTHDLQHEVRVGGQRISDRAGLEAVGVVHEHHFGN